MNLETTGIKDNLLVEADPAVRGMTNRLAFALALVRSVNGEVFSSDVVRFLSNPILVMIALLFFAGHSFAQTQNTNTNPNALRTLSLKELMDIEVTSVSKRPEKLSETASAIQVITKEDIRRSGVTSLPEALRLASNLEVAQVDSRQWAISARGFNNTTANKMLVLIDGRTVYTPLYAGVFWDAQNPLLEDVDRIEVTGRHLVGGQRSQRSD